MATWLTPGQDPWDDDLKTYIDDTAAAVADAATDDATAAVSAIVDGVVATAPADITAASDAAIAAASAVAIGTWQATTPYTSAQTVQAPDGSLIKANSSRTSRASFDATEQTFWTPVSTKSGTVEKAALDAVYGGLTANNHFSGQAGFGTNTPLAKLPWGSAQTIDAGIAGSGDLIGHAMTTNVTGDFTASGTGADPLFGWGLDVFTIGGAAANDGNGGHIGNLIETFAKAASGTIASVRGLEVGAGTWGAAYGATITELASMRVNGPFKAVGATGGAATKVYSLFVGGPAITGTTSTFSLWVDDGTSSFTSQSGSKTPLLVVAGSSPSVDLFRVSISGSSSKFWVAQDASMRSTAGVRIFDSTGATALAGVDGAGLHYYSSTNEQTTVGATGSASALPGLPVKYLKVTDSTGTVLVIPAYNH